MGRRGPGLRRIVEPIGFASVACVVALVAAVTGCARIVVPIGDASASVTGRLDAAATSADARGSTTSGESDAACDGACLAERVTWSSVSAASRCHANAFFESCRAFQMHIVNPRAEVVCGNGFVDCPQLYRTSVGDLERALANDDVVDALRHAPARFGNLDDASTYFEFIVNDSSVRIGPPCSGAPGCRPTPAGVEAVRRLLMTMSHCSDGTGFCAW
jgi:hypothetical protein